MQIGMRQYSAETVEWFQRQVQAGHRSRQSLARELCELENWRNGRGELCVSSARKVLPQLAARLQLSLPRGPSVAAAATAIAALIAAWRGGGSGNPRESKPAAAPAD